MFMSPGFLAEVTTKLADGPVVRPVVVEAPTGVQRLVILWRELPQRVAAVLAVVGGVLWLMVAPAAPAAAGHAMELLQNYRPAATAPAMVEAPERPAPVVPAQPRKRTRTVESAASQQDRRRNDLSLTVRVVPVGNPA